MWVGCTLKLNQFTLYTISVCVHACVRAQTSQTSLKQFKLRLAHQCARMNKPSQFELIQIGSNYIWLTSVNTPSHTTVLLLLVPYIFTCLGRLIALPSWLNETPLPAPTNKYTPLQIGPIPEPPNWLKCHQIILVIAKAMWPNMSACHPSGTKPHGKHANAIV